MKVLMLGWNSQPDIIDYAFYNLSKDLGNKDITVTYFMPYRYNGKSDFLNVVSLRDIEETSTKNLHEDMEIYANKAVVAVKNNLFDLVHCVDWRTYCAGVKIKERFNKPLVVYAPNTSFNRKKDGREYDAEKLAFEKADLILVPTEQIKKTITNRYSVKEDKIKIINYSLPHSKASDVKNKTVLFLGSGIREKEALYFVKAAKEVLKFEPDTSFLVAASSEILQKIIDSSIKNNISEKIKYIGCPRYTEILKSFDYSSVILVPSGSETFGLSALLALKNNKIAIVARQLELSSVVKNVLKADFWNTHELVDKIIGVIRYEQLASELRFNTFKEVRKLNNESFAGETFKAYSGVVNSW